MSFSGSFIDLDRAAQQALGIRKPVLLQPDQPKPAKHLKMALITHQQHLIELLGLRQPAAVMQRHRPLEMLKNEIGRHESVARRCTGIP